MTSVLFVFFFVQQLLVRISSSLIFVPVIRNVSLKIPGYNSTTINSTCHECLCAMLLNKTLISSFNCIANSQSCELFSQSDNINSSMLISNTASSVYFFKLPIVSTYQRTSSFSSELLWFSPHRRNRPCHISYWICIDRLGISIKNDHNGSFLFFSITISRKILKTQKIWFSHLETGNTELLSV